MDVVKTKTGRSAIEALVNETLAVAALVALLAACVWVH